MVEIGGFAPGEPKLDPTNAVLIGARDIDEPEKRTLRDIGIAIYTMERIDRLGMHVVVKEAIDIASRGTDGVHVSFDVDSIDPTVAPGVGTPSRGGLTYREAHTAMELIAESRMLSSLEVAEVNPILDDRNSTARVAVELVASALGKRII